MDAASFALGIGAEARRVVAGCPHAADSLFGAGAKAAATLLENRPTSATTAPDAAADVPVETGAAEANRAEAIDMVEGRLSGAETTAPAAPKVRSP